MVELQNMNVSNVLIYILVLTFISYPEIHRKILNTILNSIHRTRLK